MSGFDLVARVVGAEEVVARFEGAPERVHGKVHGTVQSLGLKLLRRVKDDALSGGVLNVRSGRLRRSTTEETTEAGETISSAVGTNVSYGRFWELGGTIPAHDIVARKAGALFWPGAAHPVARVHQPARTETARPFLQPSLAAMKDEIRASLLAAATEAI